MTRRAALLTAIALCALVANAFPPALAQQPEKVLRIGILSPAEKTSTKMFDAFRERLHELGYIEGRNSVIEYRLSAGDFGRLPALAADLARGGRSRRRGADWCDVLEREGSHRCPRGEAPSARHRKRRLI